MVSLLLVHQRPVGTQRAVQLRVPRLQEQEISSQSQPTLPRKVFTTQLVLQPKLVALEQRFHSTCVHHVEQAINAQAVQQHRVLRRLAAQTFLEILPQLAQQTVLVASVTM